MEVDVPLASATTLQVGGPAKQLVTATREEDVVQAVSEGDERAEPVLVLGGGSNLLVADEGFAGTVVRIATRGRAIERDGDRVVVTVAGGEPWDAFVSWAVSEGLSGIECLAGIPGLVGAVPMQNVGAYGQDVSETIVRLRAWDRDAKKVVTIEAADCGFAYRHSVFRGKDRHVILDVTFALERSDVGRPVRYAELAKALGVRDQDRAPLALTRDTIVALRRKKGMVLDASDPDTTSAGSFFTNPILDADAMPALRARARDVSSKLPEYPEAGGRTKVAAGWLIENAGFAKGFALGRAAISSKHALALTNRGGATASEILALARTVRAGVHDRFGVMLENEPVFVSCAL
jgi:UDP-N-acetylenolpyruvoylglucosamine reductase